MPEKYIQFDVVYNPLLRFLFSEIRLIGFVFSKAVERPKYFAFFELISETENTTGMLAIGPFFIHVSKTRHRKRKLVELFAQTLKDQNNG